MGMIDQVFRDPEPMPLSGPLAEIQKIIDRAQSPVDPMPEQAALAAIARLAADTGPTYQKAWG